MSDMNITSFGISALAILQGFAEALMYLMILGGVLSILWVCWHVFWAMVYQSYDGRNHYLDKE